MTSIRYMSALDPNIVRGIEPSSSSFYHGLASRIHHRGYLSVIAHSVQAFRMRIMMTEASYASTTKEAVRVIKPRRKVVIAVSYLDAKPSRLR